ncbi:MAG: hypothetical protein F7C35_00675 [Desulfurococcales archaeon]|nr:hypothetical protein [Desulfurococcales archaeon]
MKRESSSRKCLEVPGAPKWCTTVAEWASQGLIDKILSTPGAPLFLALAGLRRIEAERYPTLTLGCCGNVYAELNGGGLYSELRANPSLSQGFPTTPLTVEAAPIVKKFCKGETRPLILNPLGWRNHTVLTISGEQARCHPPLARPGLEPLNFHSPERACLKLTDRPQDFKAIIGDFKVRGSFRATKAAGGLLWGGNGQAWMLYDREAQSLTVGGEGELEVAHPFYEVKASLLSTAVAFSRWATHLKAEANAASIEGPRGSLALASSNPFQITISPGSLRVSFKGDLRIAGGGILKAVRLMHESLVRLKVEELCGRGIGHARLARSIAYVHTVRDNGFSMFAYSPVSDGLLELRGYLPLKKVTVRDVDGVDEITVSADLFRVPLPHGFLGEIDVEVGGSIFLRLRARGARGL